MLGRLGIDGFLLALLAVIAVAALFPWLGADGGVLPVSYVARYGVCAVFFLYGLTLAPEKLRAGVQRWPVHLITQLATFVLFPAIVGLAGLLAGAALPPALWLGLVYLAALPSTVSSSVALTSLARGSVPLSVFNATLSSVLGVFLTPVILAMFASAAGQPMPLGPVILKVVLLVLLPIALGQLARGVLKDWAARRSAMLKLVDRGVILAIVFGAFCNATAQGVWSGQGASLVAGIVATVLLLFALVYAIVGAVCRAAGLRTDERIACLFCASTKSLATGVPLAGVLLGDRPDLGLIIAPLMVYHLAQLIIVTVLANRYAARPLEAAA